MDALSVSKALDEMAKQINDLEGYQVVASAKVGGRVISLTFLSTTEINSNTDLIEWYEHNNKPKLIIQGNIFSNQFEVEQITDITQEGLVCSNGLTVYFQYWTFNYFNTQLK